VYYTILAAKHKGTDIVELDGKGSGWLDSLEGSGDSFQKAVQDAAKKFGIPGEIKAIAGNPSTKFRAVIGDDTRADWMDFIIVLVTSK